MKKYFVPLFILLFSVNVFAANHYIRSGASGANDGSSWANAWTSFGAITTGNWVRGDTYYVAGGTYAGFTIPSKAGTSQIIIKKANAADNGGDAGWDSSYATTQAVFSAGMASLASFIEVDGVTGSGMSGHGIKISSSNDTVVWLNSTTGSHHLHHIEIQGPGFAYGSTSLDGVYYDATSNKGLYISYCWIHEIPRNGITLGGVTGTSYSDYGMLLENSVISETGGVYIAYPGIHGQGIQVSYGKDESYLIIRNNIFRNILGTAVIAYLGGGAHSQSRIYNNIFYTTDARAGVSRALYWHVSSTSVDGMYIYNNTFYNQSDAFIGCEWVGATNIESKNNLWINSIFSDNHRGVTVKSNNDYYNNTGAGVPTGETNQKTESADPFVNSAGYDFRLKSTANARDNGIDLSSVFATDIVGTTRPQGLAWDIGAYEYYTGLNPAPPGNVRIMP